MNNVLKRLLGTVAVVWGTLTILFLAFFLLPGDRVDQLMSGDRLATPQVRANLEAKLGLDKPLATQYGRYWERLGHGDLGNSFSSNRPVTNVLADTVPQSARLAFWAVLIEGVVGVGLGVISAVGKRRVIRVGVKVLAVVALSVPVFLVGNVLQLGFAVFPFQHDWAGWLSLPAQGIGPDDWVLGILPAGDQWRYLALPSVTLALVSTVIVSRLTNSTLSQAMLSEHIRGARAKGISERRVLFNHGLRNSLVPIVTFLAVDLGSLFGSAVITETVFDWPGVGNTVAFALSARDAPVVLGVTLVLVLFYVASNLFVDMLAPRLDPRLRGRR